MKTTVKLKHFFLSVLVICAIGCNPEDGEDGAMGPAGQQGIQGEAGEDGQNGNANVVSVLLEDQTIENGDNIYELPELTQSIFDTGVVLAYVTVTGNNYWETLPLSLGGSIILEIDRIEVGKLTLKATFTQSNLRLRFIFIESSALAGKITTKNIEKMTYEEAMNHFGLAH